MSQIVFNFLMYHLFGHIDVSKIQIMVDNGNNNITLQTIENIEESIKLFYNKTFCENSRIFSYKDFECKIEFKNGSFRGNIIKLPYYYVNLFSFDEENIKKQIYEPHGGFTYGNIGFDCAHFSDIRLKISSRHLQAYYELEYNLLEKMRKTAFFRTEKFVEIEIEKIVDSIIKIIEERQTNNFISELNNVI